MYLLLCNWNTPSFLHFHTTTFREALVPAYAKILASCRTYANAMQCMTRTTFKLTMNVSRAVTERLMYGNALEMIVNFDAYIPAYANSHVDSCF